MLMMTVVKIQIDCWSGQRIERADHERRANVVQDVRSTYEGWPSRIYFKHHADSSPACLNSCTYRYCIST